MQVASLVLAFVVGASRAKPVYLANRDAVAPPITNPTAQTVWRAGETQTVTWDVSALNGSTPSNPLAQIILGTLTPDGDEHLMFQTPLAKGFPILGGNVTLTVPSVPSGETYIVCLFGTSDDISPTFTIIGTDASSSAAPSSAPSSSAPSLSGPALSTASTAEASSAAPAATTATTSVVSATPTSPSSSTTARSNPPPSSLSGGTNSASVLAGNATSAAVSSPSGSASAAAGTSGASRIAVQGHLWGSCLALFLALAL
ncbi:uncharacterized protein TRAVEDRAFT_46403 [Trametes versicolor FP-101664 SS1]|uniref:uncharacterized protein n=1 Tax=Trametes versicolor (strain FP-101664) TaxID=717944 RepID=UPI00046213A5|nr:uncharacterized protein TRAVEDRAFT_46403 [Trametes versicolor FP-101664 SS1]EIW59092.1 hypothetical protein TRAVEDRAFT_46403 [Trametes versicolor FP-101664 SS1]